MLRAGGGPARRLLAASFALVAGGRPLGRLGRGFLGLGASPSLERSFGRRVPRRSRVAGSISRGWPGNAQIRRAPNHLEAGLTEPASPRIPASLKTHWLSKFLRLAPVSTTPAVHGHPLALVPQQAIPSRQLRSRGLRSASGDGLASQSPRADGGKEGQLTLDVFSRGNGLPK